MKIEVLCTTMHQNDFSKYTEMNLQTDAVIANQADICSFEENVVDGKRVRLVTTDTRGVSINRNIAVLYSDADIIVFADDDQRFVEGYEEIIRTSFEEHPDADAIKFYCESTNPDRPLSYKKANSFHKAKKRNIMSAGVPGLAIKRDFLIRNNIFFNVNIGPGREIFCGEDSVFINNLLKKKALIYYSPELISYVDQGESSWFKGYDDQFFISCGYIYACIYKFLAPLAIIRRAINNKKSGNNVPLKTMVLLMLKGWNRGNKDK